MNTGEIDWPPDPDEAIRLLTEVQLRALALYEPLLPMASDARDAAAQYLAGTLTRVEMLDRLDTVWEYLDTNDLLRASGDPRCRAARLAICMLDVRSAPPDDLGEGLSWFLEVLAMEDRARADQGAPARQAAVRRVMDEMFTPIPPNDPRRRPADFPLDVWGQVLKAPSDEPGLLAVRVEASAGESFLLFTLDITGTYDTWHPTKEDVLDALSTMGVAWPA